MGGFGGKQRKEKNMHLYYNLKNIFLITCRAVVVAQFVGYLFGMPEALVSIHTTTSTGFGGIHF